MDKSDPLAAHYNYCRGLYKDTKIYKNSGASECTGNLQVNILPDIISFTPRPIFVVALLFFRYVEKKSAPYRQ